MADRISRLWQKLRGEPVPSPDDQADDQVVTVVSGLPRSGTSMMMKMLDEGGLPPLTDGIRTADKDNPKGYYEFERVKKLVDGDIAWVPEAQGKAVKVIAALVQYLPPDHVYKMIFMQRNMDEILSSQRQMLVRRGEPTDTVDDGELATLFRKHLDQVTAWIALQPNIDVLYVNYNQVLADPSGYAQEINQFLGNTLDAGKMAQVIDPNLYRQREA
jgi:hypothetical protein